MNKIASNILKYLKDWKNLLAHALIGIGILVVAIFLPIKPIYRVILLVVVIVFNVTRMRLSKRKKAVEMKPAGKNAVKKKTIEKKAVKKKTAKKKPVGKKVVKKKATGKKVVKKKVVGKKVVKKKTAKKKPVGKKAVKKVKR